MSSVIETVAALFLCDFNFTVESIDIKRTYRLLKVCYVATTSTAFFSLFLAAATNSTNETNKQVLHAIISLSFLDVYG
jgi:hypothetical protein